MSKPIICPACGVENPTVVTKLNARYAAKLESVLTSPWMLVVECSSCYTSYGIICKPTDIVLDPTIKSGVETAKIEPDQKVHEAPGSIGNVIAMDKELQKKDNNV